MGAVCQKAEPFHPPQIGSMKKPIAVFLPKSADSLVAFMGILYSGNIYAPLDVHSPAARIKHLGTLGRPTGYHFARIFGVFACDGCRPRKPHRYRGGYDTSVFFDNEEVLGRLDELIDTDPIYIIHTSGSTGTPKGVVISHKGVINYIDWAVACFDIARRKSSAANPLFTSIIQPWTFISV